MGINLIVDTTLIIVQYVSLIRGDDYKLKEHLTQNVGS